MTASNLLVTHLSESHDRSFCFPCHPKRRPSQARTSCVIRREIHRLDLPCQGAHLIHPQTHDLAYVAAYPLRRYQPTTTHADCAWTGTVRVQQPAPVGAPSRPHALAHRLYPAESYVGQRSFEPHHELIMGVSRWLRRLPNTFVTTGAFPPLRFATAKKGVSVPQPTFAHRLESHLKATRLRRCDAPRLEPTRRSLGIQRKPYKTASNALIP